MAVHFCPVLEVISRTTSRTKKPNSGESGATSGPSSAAFRLSASMLTRMFCWRMLSMLANAVAGIGRAGESHNVAQLQMIEQIVRRAAQDRQRSRRKNAGLDNRADHLLRQPGGRRRRLCQHRDAGQQTDGGFLPKSPRREVEGIDVNGHSVERHADVQIPGSWHHAPGAWARHRAACARCPACRQSWQSTSACRSRRRCRSQRRLWYCRNSCARSQTSRRGVAASASAILPSNSARCA